MKATAMRRSHPSIRAEGPSLDPEGLETEGQDLRQGGPAKGVCPPSRLAGGRRACPTCRHGRRGHSARLFSPKGPLLESVLDSEGVSGSEEKPSELKTGPNG